MQKTFIFLIFIVCIETKAHRKKMLLDCVTIFVIVIFATIFLLLYLWIFLLKYMYIFNF